MIDAKLVSDLLIVDDDDNFRTTLTVEFTSRGYEVTAVASAEEFSRVRPVQCAFALIDLKLERESGLRVLRELLEDSPSCRAVIMSGYGSIATAVTAIKLGAHDYLVKPMSVAAVEDAFLRDGQRQTEITGKIQDAEVPSLARHEREYVEYVLAQCGGNISEAARRLGLHRQSLQRKLRKYPPSR